ncbi:MAG: VCBS repeat-containing protein [Armatimonadetes bacterium]|nr:VCBS repeat-containing protein [Armatimonadota bacterium]MDW8029279.1 VCBS repeat-containing protein [Armatimonadota bacterium]
MQRTWKFVAVTVLLSSFLFWWLMPLRVERIFLGNISPDFQSWCSTDLDNDDSPEILLSYVQKPPVLVRVQTRDFETETLIGVDSVVLPSPDYPQSLFLPSAKSVPAKAKGQFWMVHLKKGLVSLQPFPKVERPDYVVWSDADNDGKANDLIVRSKEKRFWFVMDEKGEWKFKAQLPSGPKRPLIGIADFDEDSKPDLVMGGQNYSVLWGSGKPETKLGSSERLANVQLADLDEDGRAEIVALKREGSFMRLVIWRFEPSQNRLVSSASQKFERYVAVITGRTGFQSRASLPLERNNLWVADLDSDGLKEVIVYAGDEWFSDILYASLIQMPLRVWSSSQRTNPIILVPSPSPPTHSKVLFPNSCWLLVALGGKQILLREIEAMRETQQPVSCFRLRNQSLVITEQWKNVRRFHPRFRSLNPLVLTWWEEGIVKHGTLWRVNEIDGAKAVRCEKVLDLPGSPRLVADLNGDGISEIVWVREFVGTFDEPIVAGITAWKLGKWRKVAWILTKQSQNQQIISAPPSSLTYPLILALHGLKSHRPFPTPKIRFLPVKVGDVFELLIALPEGTIERVRFN